MGKKYTKIIFVKSLFRLIVLGCSQAKILDYTIAQYVPLPKGEIAVYKSYLYLIHSIYLSGLENDIGDLRYIKNIVKDKNQVASIGADENEIRRLFSILRSSERKKRSIDFIGSALKFIAGTPDHNDLVILNEREDRLIEAEHQQIEINTIFTKRINELTKEINTLRTNANLRKPDGSDIFELTSIRNQRIISLLTNIIYSISLAKLNIVNEVLLSTAEVKEVLDAESLPISLSSLLSASKVKVYASSDEIKYIIKIPNLEEICPLVKVFPVIHNNVILDLRNNYVSTCKNSSKALQNCVDSTNVYIRYSTATWRHVKRRQHITYLQSKKLTRICCS